MKVLWKRHALAHLERVRLYVAEQNPAAAAGVGNTLLKAESRLADFPSIGRPGRVSNTRELGVSGLPFILPYTVAGNRVPILAVTCMSIDGRTASD